MALCWQTRNCFSVKSPGVLRELIGFYPLVVELTSVNCVVCLITPSGGRGRDVEEHAAMCPGRNPRQVGLPGKRPLRLYSAKCCIHGGHLAGPRNSGVEVPVYLAPLQPQKQGSDSELTSLSRLYN